MKNIIKVSCLMLLLASVELSAQNYNLIKTKDWPIATNLNDNDRFVIWNPSGLADKTVRWDTIISLLDLEAATNYFSLTSTNLYPNSSTYNLIIGGTTAPASTKLYVVGNSNLTGDMILGGDLTLSATKEVQLGGGAKIRSDGTGNLQLGDASNSYTSLSNLVGSTSLFSKSGSNIYPGTGDNLLLGTTSNSSNYRFRVVGSGNISGILRLNGSLKMDGEIGYAFVNSDTIHWENTVYDDAGIFVGYSAGNMTFYDENNSNTTLSDLANVSYSELTNTPADVNTVGIDSATTWGTRMTSTDTIATTVFQIGDSTFIDSDFDFSGVTESQLSDSTRAAVTESNTYTDNQITNFSDTLTRGEVTEAQLSDSTRAAVTESKTYTDSEINNFVIDSTTRSYNLKVTSSSPSYVIVPVNEDSTLQKTPLIDGTEKISSDTLLANNLLQASQKLYIEHPDSLTIEVINDTVYFRTDKTIKLGTNVSGGGVTEAQLSDSTRAAVTESNTYTDNQITNFSDTLTRGEVTESQLSDSTRAAVTESKTYTDSEITNLSSKVTSDTIMANNLFQLGDSSVTTIMEDTLVNPVWVRNYLSDNSSSYTFSEGVTESGGTVTLGGSITSSVNINVSSGQYFRIGDTPFNNYFSVGHDNLEYYLEDPTFTYYTQLKLNYDYCRFGVTDGAANEGQQIWIDTDGIIDIYNRPDGETNRASLRIEKDLINLYARHNDGASSFARVDSTGFTASSRLCIEHEDSLTIKVDNDTVYIETDKVVKIGNNTVIIDQSKGCIYADSIGFPDGTYAKTASGTESVVFETEMNDTVTLSPLTTSDSIQFNQESFDESNDFDSYTFVAPLEGVYHLYSLVDRESSLMQVYVMKNNVTELKSYVDISDLIIQDEFFVKLHVGDRITVKAINDSGSTTYELYKINLRGYLIK